MGRTRRESAAIRLLTKRGWTVTRPGETHAPAAIPVTPFTPSGPMAPPVPVAPPTAAVKGS